MWVERDGRRVLIQVKANVEKMGRGSYHVGSIESSVLNGSPISLRTAPRDEVQHAMQVLTLLDEMEQDAIEFIREQKYEA